MPSSLWYGSSASAPSPGGLSLGLDLSLSPAGTTSHNNMHPATGWRSSDSHASQKAVQPIAGGRRSFDSSTSTSASSGADGIPMAPRSPQGAVPHVVPGTPTNARRAAGSSFRPNASSHKKSVLNFGLPDDSPSRPRQEPRTPGTPGHHKRFSNLCVLEDTPARKQLFGGLPDGASSSMPDLSGSIPSDMLSYKPPNLHAPNHNGIEGLGSEGLGKPLPVLMTGKPPVKRRIPDRRFSDNNLANSSRSVLSGSRFSTSDGERMSRPGSKYQGHHPLAHTPATPQRRSRGSHAGGDSRAGPADKWDSLGNGMASSPISTPDRRGKLRRASHAFDYQRKNSSDSDSEDFAFLQSSRNMTTRSIRRPEELPPSPAEETMSPGAPALPLRKRMQSFGTAEQQALVDDQAVRAKVEAAKIVQKEDRWGMVTGDLRQPKEEQTDAVVVNSEDLEYRLQCARDSGFLNLTYNQWPRLPDQVDVWLGQNGNKLKSLNLEGNQTRCFAISFGSMLNLVSLNLASNAMEALPELICQLPFLSSLSVEKNALTKLPEELGNCSSLTYLDISRNQLSWLPESLSSLKRLFTLKVTHNKLCHLPEPICDMTSLQEINASHNLITGLPAQIASLTKLEALNLDHNKLTALPETIGGLWRSLTELGLSQNALSILPKSLGACKKIEVLELAGNPMVVPPKAVVREGVSRVLSYLSGHDTNNSQDPRLRLMASLYASGNNSASKANIANIVSTISSELSQGNAGSGGEHATCGFCVKLCNEMAEWKAELAMLSAALEEKDLELHEVHRDCEEIRNNMLRKQNRLREAEDALNSKSQSHQEAQRQTERLEAELEVYCMQGLSSAQETAARLAELELQNQAFSQRTTEQATELASLSQRWQISHTAAERSQAALEEATRQVEKATRAQREAEKSREQQAEAAAAREAGLMARIKQLEEAGTRRMEITGTSSKRLLRGGEFLYND